MRILYGLSHRDKEGQRLIQRHRTHRKITIESLPLDKTHHEIQTIIIRDPTVKDGHDIGMIQRSHEIDFTLKTDTVPDQKIARLDYDATYDKASGQLDADVKLYFMPIEANPMDAANLKDPIANKVTGVRVTPP